MEEQLSGRKRGSEVQNLFEMQMRSHVLYVRLPWPSIVTRPILVLPRTENLSHHDQLDWRARRVQAVEDPSRHSETVVPLVELVSHLGRAFIGPIFGCLKFTQTRQEVCFFPNETFCGGLEAEDFDETVGRGLCKHTSSSCGEPHRYQAWQSQYGGSEGQRDGARKSYTGGREK